ncbi:hypothetical protein BDV11DRAFT_56489 [Aspergillus similis]
MVLILNSTREARHQPHEGTPHDPRGAPGVKSGQQCPAEASAQAHEWSCHLTPLRVSDDGWWSVSSRQYLYGILSCCYVSTYQAPLNQLRVGCSARCVTDTRSCVSEWWLGRCETPPILFSPTAASSALIAEGLTSITT